MIQKIKDLYYKPRSGKFWDFPVWVLTDNKAFKIVYLISHVSPVILMVIFLFSAFYFNLGFGFKIMFMVFLLASSWRLFNFIKAYRKGLYDDMCLANLTKWAVVEDGHKTDGTEQNNAVYEQPIGKEYQRITEGVSNNPESSESGDISFLDLIQESEDNPEQSQKDNAQIGDK